MITPFAAAILVAALVVGATLTCMAGSYAVHWLSRKGLRRQRRKRERAVAEVRAILTKLQAEAVAATTQREPHHG